jgi:hypothetical protein
MKKKLEQANQKLAQIEVPAKNGIVESFFKFGSKN